MEWRPSRILTICVMILAVNYLITDHRCSILRHEQETFMVTNATIISATLREQWSLGMVYSCLVDVQYTPMLTSSAAASAATATATATPSSSSSSSRTSSDTGDTDGTTTNGATNTDATSSSSPPMDTQSWPPVHHVRHTASTARTNVASTATSSSLVAGNEQKVWVELSCPSSRFCQHHCQTGMDQLWYDPSSPSPTRRLSWLPPDADGCYGFIMGVIIAIGICCMGILADWMVDKKCPARSPNYASSSDLAALLASSASSTRGYPGYGHTLHGHATASSSLYRGNHSNIHGYGSIS